MNKRTSLLVALLLPVFAMAQDGTKTLAATMEVYVFPTEGQDQAQQSKDEASCYDWAVTNVGADPFDIEAQQEVDEAQAQADMEAAEQSGRGAGTRGALRGAAAGALIGEIVDDDASKGAAIGAGAGLIRGNRQAREAQQQAQAQAAAQAEEREEASEEDLDNFKKAFSVCLEAKDYLVKY